MRIWEIFENIHGSNSVSLGEGCTFMSLMTKERSQRAGPGGERSRVCMLVTGGQVMVCQGMDRTTRKGI